MKSSQCFKMSSSTATGNKSNATNIPPNSHRQGILPAMEYLACHKKDVLLWITRVTTQIYVLLYLVPIYNANPYGCYQKALIASGATSIFRLHQRIPHVEFSREFLTKLLQEDSCHYFFYSLIFLYTYPTTLVLLPLFLFANLHSASFSSKVLEIMGNYPFLWAARFTSSQVDQHYPSVLRLIAFTEIFLMPLNAFLPFIGKGSFLTPFVYYRFLTLRYQSKRNPYTRDVFHALRLSVEVLASHQAVPDRLRRLCYKLIALVSRLAPPIIPATPPST